MKRKISFVIGFTMIFSLLLVSLLPVNSFASEVIVIDTKYESVMPQDLYNNLQGRWERVGGHYGQGEVNTSYYIIEGQTAYLYMPEVVDNVVVGFTKYTYSVSYENDGYGNSLFADDDWDGYGHYYEIKINNGLYRLFDDQLDMLVAIWYENGEVQMSGTSSCWKDNSYTPSTGVTGITISQTWGKISVGERLSLVARVSPSNATNQNVFWSSSNSSVATVYENGKVVGLSVGNAVITAESQDGGYKATCEAVVIEQDDTDDSDYDSTSQTMYRIYKPNSGEHFYTSNNIEKNALISAGWNYEGTAWNAPQSGNPVYRLFNPNAITGSHHYTMDVTERNNLVNAGWYDEGVGWYSASSSGTPLLRLYNPNSGDHHYTTSTSERNALVAAGWDYEGIAWYGQ